MRIGIDARILQETLRGQGQYTHYLIKYLARRAPENEYIVFFNGLRRGKIFSSDLPSNVRQVWCHVPGTLLKPCWEIFRRPPVESFIGKVDVFHSPFNYTFVHHTPLPSVAPRVVTFNGMAHPSTIWDHYDERRINAWFREIARTSSRIICVSEMVRKDLESRVAVPSDVVRVVHYGVSDMFKPIDDTDARARVLARYGLGGKRFILYVGAAEKNKNLTGLLEAFALYRKKNNADALYLVLAGSIDAVYQRLIKEVSATEISRHVLFPGFIGHDDLPAVYSAAAVFVLPTFSEWFGIPILEALACGTATVASEHCGALEAVGDAVITFDPTHPEEIAQALSRILQDPGLRALLREKGMARARACSWEQTADKTLAVYRQACAR